MKQIKTNFHKSKSSNWLIAAVLLSTVYCLLSAISFAQSRDVPFTLEDRDRIIQTQKEVASLRNEMNTRFESQQKEITSLRSEMNTRFESLRNEMNTRFDTLYWAFGIIVALVLFQLGYTIWDRKTVTEPIRERTQSLIQSLREYAKEQPKLADILRLHGLM